MCCKSNPAVLHLSEITRFSNSITLLFPLYSVLHLSEITRFSNLLSSLVKGVLVLHLSEITRFSNRRRISTTKWAVLHLSEITRFSNRWCHLCKDFTVLHLSEITRFSNLKWSSPNLYTWWYCNFRYLYFTIKHLSLSIINVFSLSSTKRSSDSINNRKIFL